MEATTPGLYTCSVQYRDITESQSSELRMACKLSHYPTERKYDWNLNLAVPLMANSLNLDSAYYENFINLFMYVILKIKTFEYFGEGKNEGEEILVFSYPKKLK